MKKITFIISFTILFQFSSEMIFGQNSIVGVVKFTTSNPYLKNNNYGADFRYVFGMSEKWSFLPGLQFTLGGYEETAELIRVNSSIDHKDDFIKFNKSTFGLNLSLKRFLGPNADNDIGGIYLKFGLGAGLYSLKYTSPSFDTSQYQGIYSGVTNELLIANEKRKMSDKYFTGYYGFGYEMEVVDLIMLNAEFGYHIQPGVPLQSAGVYFCMGIRKSFFKPD